MGAGQGGDEAAKVARSSSKQARKASAKYKSSTAPEISPPSAVLPATKTSRSKRESKTAAKVAAAEAAAASKSPKPDPTMLVDGGAQQTSFGSHFSLSTLSGLINSSSSGLGNENLIFDIDPTNPVFLVVTTVLAMTLLSIWRLGYNIIRRRRRKSLQSAADPRGSRAAGVGGVGGDDGVGERSIRTPTRLGVVTRAGGRRGARLVVEKVTGSAEEQARLCEVLYDVYDGQVPAGGINSKDVRSCGLTATEISRRFQHIRQNRAEKDETAGAATTTPTTPTKAKLYFSPAPHRPVAAAIASVTTSGLLSSSSSAGKRSSSKHRSTATGLPSSPKSTRVTPTKRAAPSKGSTAKRVSKMSDTRGKQAVVRSPSSKARVSPKKGGSGGATGSTRKTPGSTKKSTPAKRGSSSILEQARREAQLQTDSVASARAESLTGSKRAKPSP